MLISARRHWLHAALFALMLALAPSGLRAQALYDAFIRAVTTDDVGQVRAMLTRGIDPNTVDPNGEPVLVVAARAGWEPTVEALLAAGAKVDATNPFGDRPVMGAPLSGHPRIVKKLLNPRAPPDKPGWKPPI